MQKVYSILFSLLFICANGQERKNAIKFEPLTLTKNFLEIGLEHKINELKTAEITLGIIGLNKQDITSGYYESYAYKANGFFIKTNYKKVFSKITKAKMSAFSGLYYSPEIAFAKFTETRKWTSNSGSIYKEYGSQYELQAFSIMLNLGAKIIIKNRILLDGYLGIGSCFDNRNNASTVYNSRENNFIARRYFETNRLATQLGLKIGYLF
jgi:hypothetical protein